ncbi:MAG: hypothetical protein AAF587_36325 [Bacteroidota bacterium]
MSTTSTHILAHLDHMHKESLWYVFEDASLYPVKSRMHVYRDQANWGIVIEVFGYVNGRGICTSIFPYGNCFAYEMQNTLDWLHLIDRCRYTPVLDLKGKVIVDHHTGFILREYDALLIQGKKRHLLPAEKAGLATAKFPAWTFLHRLPEQDLMACLTEPKRLSQDLGVQAPSILHLDHWQHPLQDDSPSEHETFKAIAAFLSHEVASFSPPFLSPNNHWKDWVHLDEMT